MESHWQTPVTKKDRLAYKDKDCQSLDIAGTRGQTPVPHQL